MHLGVQKLNLDIFTLAPPPKKNFSLGSYHTPEANGNYSSPQGSVFGKSNLFCFREGDRKLWTTFDKTSAAYI